MGNKASTVPTREDSKTPLSEEKEKKQTIKHRKKQVKQLAKLNGKHNIVNGKQEAFKKVLARMSSTAERQMKDSIDSIRSHAEVISEINYKDYEYPFENLVFEGGGAKGQVYIGCLKALDEVGIKPKRYAGASAGAICAAMLAVGYTTEEMEELLEMNLEDVLIDHSCGLLSLLPNLLRKFGWNPGKKFLDFMGGLIEKKLGKADLTFKELYEKKGVELCVTAVNINMLSVEYFHPKTSPNMPIRLAVRMSISIPGIFQAVKVKTAQGATDVYIDGGLLCNYPIHAFDGWWLSMEQKDSFLNKIQPLSKLHKLMEKKVRFGDFNEKTLGFLVYSSLEQDLMQTELESRVGLKVSERPKTSKLFKSRESAIMSKAKAIEEHKVFIHAFDQFVKVLKHVNYVKSEKTLKAVNSLPGHESDDVIDREELKHVLMQAVQTRLLQNNSMMKQEQHEDACNSEDEDDFFTADHVEILFGAGTTLDDVFDQLDTDQSGYISYDELLLFIERSGIDIQAKFQGYDRKDVCSLSDFAVSLQDCLLMNVKKMFLEERDFQRTVGVNTDYIETTDFKMEAVDREFLIEQGRRATISYLKHYVYDNKLKKKSATSAPRFSMSRVSEESTEPPTVEVNKPAAILTAAPTKKKALPPLRGKVPLVPLSSPAKVQSEGNHTDTIASSSSGYGEGNSPTSMDVQTESENFDQMDVVDTIIHSQPTMTPLD